MALQLPSSRPRLHSDKLHRLMNAAGLDRNTHQLSIIGIRGYYRDLMGQADANDRGIYDDAIFLDTPNITAAYNGNTDPSVSRRGMAVLKPGLYLAHRFDVHRGASSQYPAICQRAGSVTVIRDVTGPDTGSFGINIHRGARNTTSSLGCQTIHPSQWDSFYATAKSEAQRLYGTRWNKVTIPYLLLVNDGSIA